MIARLRGTVWEIDGDHAVIDCGGVGYLVQCPRGTLGRLVPGQPADLHVESQTREDGTRLFGFAQPVERDWFRLLQTVQGVGGKVALAILSVLDPDRLVRALAAADKAAFARADGVGPKLAQRLVVELKDKAAGVALGRAARADGAASEVVPATTPAFEEAVDALAALGFSRGDAFTAAGAAAKSLGPDAAAARIVQTALKGLAR